jgi:hypothetical protein
MCVFFWNISYIKDQRNFCGLTSSLNFHVVHIQKVTCAMVRVCALRFRPTFCTRTVSSIPSERRKGIPQRVLDTYPCFKYSLQGLGSPSVSNAAEGMLNSPAGLLAETPGRQFPDPWRLAPIPLEEHEAEVMYDKVVLADCSCSLCSALYQVFC